MLALVGMGIVAAACSNGPSTGTSTGGGKGGAGGADGGACVHVDHFALCGECEACLEEKCCPELTACTKVESCIECVSNDPSAPHLCLETIPAAGELLGCTNKCDSCHTGVVPPCALPPDGGSGGAGGGGGGTGGAAK